MIACEPLASALVVHCAVLVSPVPVRGIGDRQPGRVEPLSPNETLPPGFAPDTLAVNVTLSPKFDGSSEVVSVVVVEASPPQLGNLNEPIRVRQLPALPLVWSL